MTIAYDIGYALDNQIESMTSAPPIAWENKVYKPIKGTLYIQPVNLPANTEGATIGGTESTDETLGVYSINVFSPLGEGKKEAVNMADTIADRFKRDTELTYNSHTVRINNVTIKQGRNDGAWYQIPIDIQYQSFTARR